MDGVEEDIKSGCVLKISEYGKVKQIFADKDYDRFIKESKRLIDDHLSNRSRQTHDEVKNITISLYTY